MTLEAAHARAASSTSAAIRSVRGLTGFARDIMLAASSGAGPVADAFFVAVPAAPTISGRSSPKARSMRPLSRPMRMSNGERGANAAGVVCQPHLYAAVPVATDPLALAWLFMQQAMSILAPGFSEDAEQRRLAIELTRITFPYLC